jgi:hypothetical protein
MPARLQAQPRGRSKPLILPLTVCLLWLNPVDMVFH